MLALVPGGFEERESADRLELAAYVGAGDEQALRAVFGEVVATPVPADWADRWRSFHRSVRAGGVWIGPPWETPPAGEPAVTIEPGRAFGTGAHPSTRLCIELLARVRRGTLVDVGCGSGVIALAAARLGFGPVSAVDIDPVAVEVARANAASNEIGLDAFVLDALAVEPPTADVTVANLSLRAVESLLTRLRADVVVTGGYLAGDELRVSGWRATARRELDGWAADVFVRS
jgi:ribosomal protein L11 methyltransferase